MKQLLIPILVIGGFVGLVALLHEPRSLEETITAKAQESQPAKVLPAQDPSPSAEETLPAQQLEVPDFEAQLTTGETVSLSSLVADKPTMIGFWASWCHNCQRNLPIQNDIYQDYKDKVNIIEVNLGEDRSQVDRYAESKGYDFMMAYDEASAIGNAYGVQYTNTHVLVAADGTLIEAFSGDITEDHFKLLAN